MSRIWKHSITVTRYSEEQRDARNRIIAPSAASSIDIPKCYVQSYKKGMVGFQVPEGRKQEDYIIYSGPTELQSSRSINEKRSPDTFEWEGYTYSVEQSISLRGRRRTDGFYAICGIVDNPVKASP